MHDGATLSPQLSAKDVEQLIVEHLPSVDHHGEVVEEVGLDSIRLRLPFKSEFAGAVAWQGSNVRVYSGPLVMGFADTSMYCCVVAALGRDVIPVMVAFNITFVRPARERDLIAEARIVRRGSRLHYLECWLKSEGEEEPCAHITSTYRVHTPQK